MQHKRYKLYLKLKNQCYWNLRRGGMLIFALLVASLVSLTSCIQQPPQPLRVGIPNWVGFATLYLAEELNYYQDVPIRLLDYPSGAELFQAFRNGEVDVLCTTMADALLLAETEPDFRVILIADTSNGADVILTKPTIKTLKDLKGQRVGVEAIATGALMLNRALEKAGLSLQDVRIVSTTISEQEAAYTRGKVDALVTFDPLRSRLLASGARQIFDSSQMPGEIVDVLVVHKDVLTEQRSILLRLIRGWFQAYKYWQQHPRRVAYRIAPLQKLSPEQFMDSLKGIQFPGLEENQRLLSNTSPTLFQATQRLSEVMLQQGLLKKSVRPTPLLTEELIKNVKL